MSEQGGQWNFRTNSGLKQRRRTSNERERMRAWNWTFMCSKNVCSPEVPTNCTYLWPIHRRVVDKQQKQRKRGSSVVLGFSLLTTKTSIQVSLSVEGEEEKTKTNEEYYTPTHRLSQALDLRQRTNEDERFSLFSSVQQPTKTSQAQLAMMAAFIFIHLLFTGWSVVGG